ncbi:MAG: hypothetical protein LBK05_04135 [Treponema sp.]|jgi:hypothetical protein|nr:hypothetical protein [Treponema sp.]
MRNFSDNFNPRPEGGQGVFGGGLRGVELEGRPFPPEGAESCLKQISAGGAGFIRFMLPWTALAGGEPGVYNEEYLAYLRKIFLAASAARLSVLVDSRGKAPDGIPRTPEEEDRFLDALRHAYRRLKNCRAVAGWVIPAQPGPDFARRFSEKMREVNPLLMVYAE